jgi:hypothetical protein
MTVPTPEELQAQIASNTQAIGRLVEAIASQQQASAQQIATNVDAMTAFDQQLEGTRVLLEETAAQQQTNAQQIAANAEAMTAFDQRLEGTRILLERTRASLEETRALVAENGSQIAQLKVGHQQVASQQVLNSQAIANLTGQQTLNTQAIANLTSHQALNAQALTDLIAENRAFRESQQSQLAAILGNGRRIDRLEQQAS